MTRVTLGLLLGVVIGGIDVLLMLPLTFPDNARRCSARSVRGSPLGSLPRPCGCPPLRSSAAWSSAS